MLFYSTILSKREDINLIGAWIGPFIIKENFGNAGTRYQSDIGNFRATVHDNRLKRMSKHEREKKNQYDGYFSDRMSFSYLVKRR